MHCHTDLIYKKEKQHFTLSLIGQQNPSIFHNLSLLKVNIGHTNFKLMNEETRKEPNFNWNYQRMVSNERLSTQRRRATRVEAMLVGGASAAYGVRNRRPSIGRAAILSASISIVNNYSTALHCESQPSLLRGKLQACWLKLKTKTKWRENSAIATQWGETRGLLVISTTF